MLFNHGSKIRKQWFYGDDELDEMIWVDIWFHQKVKKNDGRIMLPILHDVPCIYDLRIPQVLFQDIAQRTFLRFGKAKGASSSSATIWLF